LQSQFQCLNSHCDYSHCHVGKELCVQLGEQLGLVVDVVGLTLKLAHFLAKQSTRQEVGQGLENGPETKISS